MRISNTLLLLFLLITISLCAQETTIDAKILPSDIGTDGQAVLHVTFTFPEGMHQTFQEEYFYIEPAEMPGVTFGETEYPEGHPDEDGNVEYTGTVTVKRPMQIGADIAPGDYTLAVAAGFQICNEQGQCLFPEEIEVSAPFKLASAVSGDASEAVPTEKAGTSAADILKFLIMAFIGGLILNIMPCVLPVLSIKAIHLVNQSQHHKREIMKGSLAYTAGILASFLVLAAVVIIIKLSGESVGWGFQFQNFGFVMVLTSLIFVFGLSLFDVFIISAPGMSLASKASGKTGHWGSFLSGIVAVLLATPCTAPFLGAALGFAFIQPPLLIVIFFLLIGIGLAFPFILLAFWPGVIKAIPKPGNWMNVFKEFMGFLLMGTTIFLLNTVYALVGGGGNFMRVLWFIAALALAAWIYGSFAKPHHGKAQQWIALLVAVAVVVFSAMFLLRFESTEGGHSMEEGWQKFSPELLDKYIAEGKPVFVDFGAEWCMTCKTNEKTVLFTEDIEEIFEKYGVERMKGDNTRKDPLIIEWLNKFDRAGVPLYLLYRPGEDEPVVFPEIITKPMVKDELKEIGK